MLSYVRAANPLYIGILENGPYVLVKIIPESLNMEFAFRKSLYPKRKNEFIETDRK